MDKKITLEAFMAQQPSHAKVSKLEPWREDILTLKNNGYTQKQILEYLDLNGIKVSQTTLNSFIKVRQREQQTAATTKRADAQENTRAKNKKQNKENQIDKQESNEQSISRQSALQQADRPGIRRWPTADEVDLSKLY